MDAVMDDIVDRGRQADRRRPALRAPARAQGRHLPAGAARVRRGPHAELDQRDPRGGAVRRASSSPTWTNGPALVYTDTLELVKEGDVRTGGRDAATSCPTRTRSPIAATGGRSWCGTRPTGRLATAGERGVRAGALRDLRAERTGVQDRAAAPARAGRRATRRRRPPRSAGPARRRRSARRPDSTRPAPAPVSTWAASASRDWRAGTPTPSTSCARTSAWRRSPATSTARAARSAPRHWRWIAGDWKREGGPRTMTPWGAPGDDFDLHHGGAAPEEPALGEYPLQPGLTSMIDAFRAMKTGEPYPIKAYVMVQGNPLGGWCEDQKTVREGLLALDFLVDMDLYITPTNSSGRHRAARRRWARSSGAPNAASSRSTSAGPTRSSTWNWGTGSNPEMWPWASVEEWNEWARGYARPGTSAKRPRPASPWNAARSLRRSTSTRRSTRRPAARSGFATPTGRLEIYSVIAFQHGSRSAAGLRGAGAEPRTRRRDLASDYPLVLTTGARAARLLPLAASQQSAAAGALPASAGGDQHRHAAERYGIVDGDWIWIETTTGRIRMQAKVTAGHAARAWSRWPTAGGRAAQELGLPGYGWDGANANVLISGDEHDPALGVPATRSQLCRVYPARGAALRLGAALLRHHQARRTASPVRSERRADEPPRPHRRSRPLHRLPDLRRGLQGREAPAGGGVVDPAGPGRTHGRVPRALHVLPAGRLPAVRRPACAAACPEDAIVRDPQGIVAVEPRSAPRAASVSRPAPTAPSSSVRVTASPASATCARSCSPWASSLPAWPRARARP